MITRAAMIVALGLAACTDPPSNTPAPASLAHSSSIATSADGSRVYVVNADSDSISIIDTAARALVAEIALAPAPVVNPDGSFAPAVMPRALAVSSDGATLYVTGQRAGKLYAVDLASRAVTSVAVCSEPVGVVASPDGAAVYVACSQDAAVVEVLTASLTITSPIPVPNQPWGLAWGPGGSLLVSQFLGSGVTRIDVVSRATTPWTIPDTAPRGDQRLAHGAVRGLYDVATRPTSDEVWVAHVMLGIDTSQPSLDFQSTVFPSLSVLGGDGGYRETLSIDAPDLPGIDGAFGDVVSGPHAIAFTGDGAYALVVDSNSEDVLAVDARGHFEATLLRPLPGHLPEGIVLSPDERVAYIDERNSGDVAIIDIDRTDGIALAVDATIPRLASDPMPATLRLGQHLFYSANSDEYPVTTNHWVACASCHLEGRSDAVTWLFAQGPRDTPSNAGGMLGTGFLFRTADRNKVQDYWHTINVEQGGAFTPDVQADLLDAIEQYVDYGIPLPIPPTTDPAKVAAGKAIFERADVGCASCHSGARFTDSGSGNPTLDLSGIAGPITLHDVGTCVHGTSYDDVAHSDVDGDPRAACMFDTPSLSGIASSPPYLHDGSAPTLHDLLEQTRGTMGDITSLSADDEAALVEYLRSL